MKTTIPVFRLHPLFCDHAIFQQGKPIPIWGWGEPGATVSVSFLGREQSTQVGPEGSWRMDLPAAEAQSGTALRVVCGSETRELTDIAVGEVWLASGQSNMEWPLQATDHAYKEIADAPDAGLRLFTAPRRPSLEPCLSMTAPKWEVCSPEAVRNFSAVAYFFGQKLRRELGVPVGLIHSAWGGSCIQAWLPHHDAKLAEEKISTYTDQWLEWVQRECHADSGNEGEAKGWARPDFDDRAWGRMDLPGHWENEGFDLDGAVWFRREIELPAHWAGRDVVLHFGRVDDYDTTYFNGERVGGLDQRTPQCGSAQRVYIVPGRLVRAGGNLLATRIFDHAGAGGILADGPWSFCAILASSNEQRSLAGSWRMKVEKALPSRPPTIWASMPAAPLDFYAQFEPSLHRASLFNGMIAPVAPYALRGFLWYQGESNVHEPGLYVTYLRELVEGWRTWWKDDTLAFYSVQLADFINGQDEPAKGRSPWAELREAQTRVLDLPNTALAVARDVGDAYDIHPRNKKTVGQRLALPALKNLYGKDVAASGPVFESVSFADGKALVRFAQTEKGLRTGDGPMVRGFVVADDAGAFHPATAKIVGERTIEVEAVEVPKPAVVRYAWASYSNANLENSEGLPAVPFRSDHP